jgi:hypothetical protein
MKFWRKLFGVKESPRPTPPQAHSVPFPVDEYIRQHSVRFDVHEFIRQMKGADLAYLLSVEEPTLLPSDYRDANRDEPAFLASKFRSGIDSFYSIRSEAQGRLADSLRFSSLVRGKLLGLTHEELSRLALNAKAEIVRAAAAKRMAELLPQHGADE